MLLLVPTDVLRPRRPDEHFAAETAAARSAGVEVALIDHDALTRGGDLEPALARVPRGGEAVYRGWMLRSEQYAVLAEALTNRDVVLRTSAEQYRRAHELPGWYTAMETVTPQSVWTRDDSRTAFEGACAMMPAGPAVLRDYTKSMKHHWHEAAFIPDVADTDAAWRVANRFRELRGDDFVGGFVLRRFEPFTGAEVRTWWIHGTCRLRTAHPDTPDELPPAGLDLTAVTPLIRVLHLPFVTADLVRHDDGRWRVVEIGDGQVSDRPHSTAPDDLITALNVEPVEAGLHHDRA
ncbi:ATP-grasp domain-containing protein [Jidongwangia harbinensis]|uniref:ATP-grasp domain-containing protein n=1 Tax=Jidongwangia harbinensis TaxID=2878561 RepID=UPI001CD979BE|nr:ATP-grasp domain-containing protein [Jidongwangia harbinensis]MCA2217989.1 ATP-grasp domain-containing protein [Jidongwangia harbinensis]